MSAGTPSGSSDRAKRGAGAVRGGRRKTLRSARPTPLYLEEGGGDWEVTVDLEKEQVSSAAGTWTFVLERESREVLLEGLDAIDLTLRARDEIAAFRDRDQALRGWTYL